MDPKIVSRVRSTSTPATIGPSDSSVVDTLAGSVRLLFAGRVTRDSGATDIPEEGVEDGDRVAEMAIGMSSHEQARRQAMESQKLSKATVCQTVANGDVKKFPFIGAKTRWRD